jgi:hypothetical protein
MNFELNKEYKLRVVQIPATPVADKSKSPHWTVKRVKIVAFPVKNEAVIEFLGAKRYYLGIGLPVRGRMYIDAGVPSYMSSGNERYEIMNILA